MGRDRVSSIERRRWRATAYEAGGRYARRYGDDVVECTVTFMALASRFLTVYEEATLVAMGDDHFWLYFAEGARDQLALRGAK